MNNTSNYTFRKHKLNGNICFDIEQENLIYSDCTPTHHGLQCNHVGGTPEHDELLKRCDEVVRLLKIIDKLNNIK